MIKSGQTPVLNLKVGQKDPVIRPFPLPPSPRSNVGKAKLPPSELFKVEPTPPHTLRAKLKTDDANKRPNIAPGGRGGGGTDV